MNNTLFCLSFLLLFTINLYPQRNVGPTTSDIQIAETLKDKYEDKNVAIELSNDFISFDFDKKTNKVIANKKSVNNLINLDARSDIQIYCFYDGESKVNEISVKYKNDKKAYFAIKDEAYTSDGLFHNDTRVKYINLDFPLKGYKYQTTIDKKYKDIKYFTQLYFNDIYPIEKKVIKIEVPNWLNVEFREMNFDSYEIVKEIVENEDTKTYTYTYNDVNAMYNEEQSPGHTYIYPHLLVLAKSYTFDDNTEIIFNTTQDLYNWYKSLIDELKNDETSYKDKVKELTQNTNSDEEKIKNIYYWVQDNIRYIAFEDGIAGFKPDEASQVFDKKYGDCKGMANLTKQMLIEAGFDARLTWIGTKHIAYDYSIPNLSVDNHMICALIKDNKTIFLDGTEKFNAFGEYANRIQGKQALIEDGDNFIIETVPNATPKDNLEKLSYNLQLSDERLTGNASKIYFGESRTYLLHYFNTLDNTEKDEYIEWYLSGGDRNIKISNVLTSNLSDRDLQLDISYNLAIDNAVSSFDDEIYVNIDFDKEFANYDFSERKTDFLFNFKRTLNSTTTIEIPSSYTVSYLPENIAIKNDAYEFTVNFKYENNRITYSKEFTIFNTKINVSNFEEWDNFNSKLTGIYNEQIILIKK